MPLSSPSARREIHHRIIDLRAYARDDGMYDVEVHLVDRKPFDFVRDSSPQPIPAGQALHDLWVRITVDDDYVVRAIEAASDVTPWALCKQAQSTLSVMVGEKIARGWSAKVKERLRGAASCTHLMEMLLPAATVALQGIRGLHPQRRKAVDAQGVPLKIDSCFAYGREREVVLQLWPQHHRPADKEEDKT
jgi:hypothetical protein